jgi:hypothetical protein
MANNKKDKGDVIAEELKITLAESLFKLKALVDLDPSKSYDLLSIARTFLTGIIVTTADILEINRPGTGPILYADIENMAKNGRFLGIADAIEKIGSPQYSISDIGENDFENGMNYIGQKLSQTLVTCIHELPMPLRSPEMFLRGIEALLANLLNEKFNTPNDPHNILDSLCEHVHAGLNQLAEQRPRKKIEFSLTQKQIDYIVYLDKKAKQLLKDGGEQSLLMSLAHEIRKIKAIMDSSAKGELDFYCGKYNGFYNYMKLLEKLAKASSEGLLNDMAD